MWVLCLAMESHLTSELPLGFKGIPRFKRVYDVQTIRVRVPCMALVGDKTLQESLPHG